MLYILVYVGNDINIYIIYHVHTSIHPINFSEYDFCEYDDVGDWRNMLSELSLL